MFRFGIQGSLLEKCKGCIVFFIFGYLLLGALFVLRLLCQTEMVHVLALALNCLPGPLFGNIKSCGERDHNSSLQNRSHKE